MADAQIDMTPYIGAILKVMTEPFWGFIDDLHAGGRITADEVAALRTAIHDRGDRLDELVQEELQKMESSDRA